MGHNNTRRDFLKVSLVFTAGTILLPLNVFSKAQYTHAERILLGIEKPDDLTSGAFLLRKEAGDAFLKMQAAAKEQGISMYSQSSYRSFNRQMGIWERKYNLYASKKMKEGDICQKIIEYSTVPGTSRHHWGTDLDIIDSAQRLPSNPLIEGHFLGTGVYSKLYAWMKEHANSFGFYEVYTNAQNRQGFKYEPWHWSYAPLAIPMLNDFLKIDLVEFYDKTEIKGHDSLNKDFIKKYVAENMLDINPILLPKE